jgi:hypothetical protein
MQGPVPTQNPAEAEEAAQENEPTGQRKQQPPTAQSRTSKAPKGHQHTEQGGADSIGYVTPVDASLLSDPANTVKVPH